MPNTRVVDRTLTHAQQSPNMPTFDIARRSVTKFVDASSSRCNEKIVFTHDEVLDSSVPMKNERYFSVRAEFPIPNSREYLKNCEESELLAIFQIAKRRAKEAVDLERETREQKAKTARRMFAQKKRAKIEENKPEEERILKTSTLVASKS